VLIRRRESILELASLPNASAEALCPWAAMFPFRSAAECASQPGVRKSRAKPGCLDDPLTVCRSELGLPVSRDEYGRRLPGMSNPCPMTAQPPVVSGRANFPHGSKGRELKRPSAKA
jgi:hypothetical protein